MQLSQMSKEQRIAGMLENKRRREQKDAERRQQAVQVEFKRRLEERKKKAPKTWWEEQERREQARLKRLRLEEKRAAEDDGLIPFGCTDAEIEDFEAFCERVREENEGVEYSDLELVERWEEQQFA